MSDVDVKAELQEIFRDLFDDDDIVLSDSTSAKDIARWDSLQNVKLMIRVERAFKVKFGTGEVVGLKNVGELLSLIGKKRS